MFGAAPKIPGTINQTLCPNGDVPFGHVATDYNATTGTVIGIDPDGHSFQSNICLIPSANGDARCINGKNNFPVLIDPPVPIPTAQRDGRVYNLHSYSQFGGYNTDTEVSGGLGPRQITGAFYRIHTTRTVLSATPTCPGTAGDARCCAQSESNAQVGCLAEADACSLGMASRASLAQKLVTSASIETNFGASIDRRSNNIGCIVANGFPMSRETFLSSAIGFEHVTPNELALAKCFSSGVAGGMPRFNLLLTLNELIPLPAGPVCRDFVLGGGACANNILLAPIPH